MHSKVIQLHIHTHIFFFGFFLWNIFAGCSRQRARLLLRLAWQSFTFVHLSEILH